MPYHHQEEKKEKLLEKEIKNYNTRVEIEKLKNWEEELNTRQRKMEEDMNARQLELNANQRKMERTKFMRVNNKISKIIVFILFCK